MPHEQPPHVPPHAEPDPHPAGASRFLHRACAFDDPTGGVPPRRLVGVVEEARYVGRTARGQIPDYRCTVRGRSGALLEVSMVESYMTFPE
jgi:hypothetical protein